MTGEAQPPSLRALTLVQPMASAIVVADPRAKRIENRPRPLPKHMQGHETVIAVHAGLAWNDYYASLVGRLLGDAIDWDGLAAHRGCIVGLMRLTGRQYTEESPPMRVLRVEDVNGPSAEDLLMARSVLRWGFRVRFRTEIRVRFRTEVDPWWSGPYGYEIASAQALAEPVSCPEGFHRGWWAVPEHVAERVLEQLPAWRDQLASSRPA